MAAAQPADKPTQRGGTFTEPPVRVPPEYVPLGPNQPNPEGQPHAPLQLRVVLDLPLRRDDAAGSGTQGALQGSPTLQALLRWRPLEDPGWFAQVAFFRYLSGGRQRPWNPDFIYSFGYEDYRPGTWSFGYANYTGTRLRPDAAAGERRFNFPQGVWTLTHRFALPEPLREALLVGDGDSATCQASGSFAPRYTRASGQMGEGKPGLALGCRYVRPDGWFAHFTAQAWPAGGQQPWDPDYTYGLGWTGRDWAVQYGNYSGNRWPGRDLARGEGRPGSGSLSVTWSAEW